MEQNQTNSTLTLSINSHLNILEYASEVEECYVHCAKAFKRSQAWEPGSWLNQDLLPKVSKMLAADVNCEDFTEEIIAKGLKESYEKRLY
ncbi:phosphatidylinositol alpha-mannosyltransferase [Paenibacillus larvae]|uniref:phosphatidylinositol alpha-mannosyltransferase n=1 Tax=Paenibacillus larvae TaxID=1464 RepID=UPI003D2A8DE4